MTATIHRREWLLGEIAHAATFIERHAESADPVVLASMKRCERELEMLRSQLRDLDGPRALSLALTGVAIEGSNAPLGTVTTVTRRMEEIVGQFGADAMVAPATEGSHQINIVQPAATRFDDFDTFGEAANVLLGLSQQALSVGESPAERASTQAAGYTQATLIAVRELLHRLSDDGVDLRLRYVGDDRVAEGFISRAVAQDLWRALKDIEEHTQPIEVVGVLQGFTPGNGRFELVEESGRTIDGRVPVSLRSAAQGIRLGGRVSAQVDLITTIAASGVARKRYRLVSIDAVED